VVLVDLSDTEFMDCAGLAPLVAACERQRQLGGDLFLDAPSGAVSRIIECTELDKVVAVASGPRQPPRKRLTSCAPVH
jgi:stage II sporulation protein AA (anti-sigma F factor antagonist)